jgi:hypothetical protein
MANHDEPVKELMTQDTSVHNLYENSPSSRGSCYTFVPPKAPNPAGPRCP